MFPCKLSLTLHYFPTFFSFKITYGVLHLEADTILFFSNLATVEHYKDNSNFGLLSGCNPCFKKSGQENIATPYTSHL